MSGLATISYSSSVSTSDASSFSLLWCLLGRLFTVSANLSMEGRTSDFAPMSTENQVQVQNA